MKSISLILLVILSGCAPEFNVHKKQSIGSSQLTISLGSGNFISQTEGGGAYRTSVVLPARTPGNFKMSGLSIGTLTANQIHVGPPQNTLQPQTSSPTGPNYQTLGDPKGVLPANNWIPQ